MEFKFKIGDIVSEKDPFIGETIRYKVIDIFQNYWNQYLYELECLDDPYKEYGPYRPTEFVQIAHDIFDVVDNNESSRNIDK